MDFSVNPLLLNVIPPSIGSEEKYFSIQVTGEALWQWRLIKPTYPENYFLALNKSLEKLSYEVASHASDRLGRRIKIELNFLSAKLERKNSKTRKVFRGKFLRVFHVAESEMVKVPQDVIKSMKEENALLQDEIATLNNEIEEKGKVIVKLLEDGIKQKTAIKRLEMATEGLANKGKPINEVGSRQKRRQMATFR